MASSTGFSGTGEADGVGEESNAAAVAAFGAVSNAIPTLSASLLTFSSDSVTDAVPAPVPFFLLFAIDSACR